MINETRIVPITDRPFSNVRNYMGEARGRWEGDTLVVETTNFLTDRTVISGTPTSDALRLIEKFTRIDPQTLRYELTVDDPQTWTQAWTVSFDLTEDPEYPLIEYACHEGNYAMFNMLSGARGRSQGCGGQAIGGVMIGKLTLLFAAAAFNAHAHHAFQAEFDANKPITLRGTVTEMEWINPHAWIHLEVEQNGVKEKWMVEGGSPNILMRRGFSRESLPAGTKVVIQGYMAKDGSRRINGGSISLPDGKKLFLGSSGTGAPTDTTGEVKGK